jgi:hypothetical protein
VEQAYLLRVLSNHENELEVVHSQCDIVELVDVRQEDDVLDGILYDIGVICYGSAKQISVKRGDVP